MIVTNPTKENIEVQIFGVTYKVQAGESLKNVLAEAAKYWHKELHNFIQLSEDGAKVEPVVEKKVEDIEVEPEEKEVKEVKKK